MSTELFKSFIIFFFFFFEEYTSLHPSLYFQSIAVIDLIATLSTQHLG